MTRNIPPFQYSNILIMSYQVIDGINSTDIHSELFLQAMVGSVSDALVVPASAVKVNMINGNKRALLSTVNVISIISVNSGMMSDMVLSMLHESMTQGIFLTSMQEKSGLPITSISPFTLTDITAAKQSVSDPEASSTSKKGTILHFRDSANFMRV
jgi:hypothetical protein